MNLKKQITKLPLSPGVYIFRDKDENIIYVGKSVLVRNRVSSYFKTKNLGLKTQLMVSKISRIDIIKVFSEFEALLLEAQLIKKYKPFFNIQAKDDKSPLYIKISNDQIPIISTTRKPKNQEKAFVKGPFPSTKTTRETLRIVRKIFPYCHHSNPKKPCLYVHLNLCPYPHADEESKNAYIGSVNKIKELLRGKNQPLLKILNSEMANFSNNQEYEKAQTTRNQIEKLQYVLNTYHNPQEFMAQPTLVDDQAFKKLENLKNILKLKKAPKRIECYDISNIMGHFATGSMVVFTQGLPDKSEYRKFKIKFIQKPNDYEMLKQVLLRRFRNKWPKPNLIIVDGGKGQLNIAYSIINRFKLKIPIIAIAKRHEEIYTTQNYTPVSLPKENLARQIVQAARDEAHRFALNYHKLLRSKKFLN